MAKPQYGSNQSLDELISSWKGNDWTGQEWEDSLLRDYLLYDYWSPHIGLCTLSGFDYQTLDNDGDSMPANYEFANVLSPIAFMSFIGGNVALEESQLTTMKYEIDRLRNFLENSGNDKESKKYQPAFFIDWALSKNFCPPWLNWAIEKNLYRQKLAADKAPPSDFDKASLSYPPELAMDFQAGSEATVTRPESPKGAVLDPKPRPAATGPLFSMTKAAMIQQHEHEWPTVAQDIKDAVRNGLSVAKAGLREWQEADALEWARTKGKLVSIDKSGNAIAGANSIFNSPTSRKHALKD